MSLAEICLLATAVFFAVYGVACGVESGVAINLLNDKKMSSRRFFTPLWEVTNVFMVFGATAVAMLFNNALESLSRALLSTLMIGLAALIVRACTVLIIFYWRSEKLPRWLAWLFAVCCFTIPLSFTAAGAYLLFGQPFWQSFSGWTLMSAAFLGIMTIGLLTMNPKRKSIWLPNELVFAAWMVVLGSILPLAAKIQFPYLQKAPMLVLTLIGIGGLAVTLKAINDSKFKLWKYAVAAGFIAPLLLAAAHRPYFIGHTMKIDEAFSAGSYAGAFLVGTAIILPLVLLGFYLFWKLLKLPQKA